GGLRKAGYRVAGYDAREHGLSAPDRPTGMVRSFATHVQDLSELHAAQLAAAEGKPCFLLGHSMGALVTLQFLTQAPTGVAGAILTGLPLLPARDVTGFAWVAARLLSQLMPRCPSVRLDSSLISRDPQQVQRYDRDPLVYRGRLPVRSGVELLAAARQLRANPISIQAPLLVMHGSADAVARVEGSRLLVEQLPASQVDYVKPEGLYHEILNEPEGPELLMQITAWLDRHAPESVRHADRP
ncbi:MAG: alpha/beta fold hydrolase, partial [Planctomycetota bacterium]